MINGVIRRDSNTPGTRPFYYGFVYHTTKLEPGEDVFLMSIESLRRIAEAELGSPDLELLTRSLSHTVAEARGYRKRGEWIIAPADGCTCGTGGTQYGHEPGCGWEPVARREGAWFAEQWVDRREAPVISAPCPSCGQRVTRPASAWDERDGRLMVTMSHPAGAAALPDHCWRVWEQPVVEEPDVFW